MPAFDRFIETIGTLVEVAGVCVIVIGMIFSTIFFLVALAKRQEGYSQYRRYLGKGILLGLEFLVAGDIIRTVAVDPTLENTAVLGIIVLIRTFLSISLQVELEGRWPWHANRPQPDHSPGDEKLI